MVHNTYSNNAIEYDSSYSITGWLFTLDEETSAIWPVSPMSWHSSFCEWA